MKIEIEIPDGPYDYNSSAEAMVTAFEEVEKIVTKKLGLSGFQFSWAQMRYLGKSRNMKVGILIRLEDMIFPQYNLHEKLEEAIQNNREVIIEHAKEELANADLMVPRVKEHMQKIAKGEF